MPAHVVLVNDDADFVQRAAAALRRAGYDVAGYTDSMSATGALHTAAKIEVLVTKVTFGQGKPHGLSLAMMARLRRPFVRVLFTAPPEFEEHTRGIGLFLPLPVGEQDLVAAVWQMLKAPHWPEN